MGPRLWLSLMLAFLASLASAVVQERNVDVFAWSLTAAKPQAFVKVTYSSTNASVLSYSPPQFPIDDNIIRVGFYRSSGDWSGVATAASNFAPEKQKRLQLHLRSDGELYHLGFKISDGVSQGEGASTKDGLSVEVISTSPGPVPYLNKPVVVTAEGKTEEKEPEKTMLQKYWWVLGLFVALQIVMGGAGGGAAGGEGAAKS